MLSAGDVLDPTLVNTVGHSAGALLFGVVIALLIRDGRANGMGRIRLSLLAAELAFGWNIGSLVVIGADHIGANHLSPNHGDPLFIRLVSTISFSILSLLPAVLLHVTLQGKRRWLIKAGYLISICAACMHFGEVFSADGHLHQKALLLIAAGFGAVALLAACLPIHDRVRLSSTRGQWASLACLLLFTTSFLHFGYQHGELPWTAEVTWHHLGIPAALILLLQDYRFLLLDTFVRFVANSCLAAVYLTVVMFLALKFQLFSVVQASAFWAGILIVALCLSLILFAYIRNAVQIWVGQVIFRRQRLEDCLRAMSQAVLAADSEDELLQVAAAHVARHLEADKYVLVKEPALSTRVGIPSILFVEIKANSHPDMPQWRPEAQIPLRFSSGDSRVLLLGPREGGRRYLSEDLEEMQRLAAAVVESVERYRADELKSLVSQAELRALQAQINPHFLFNALNTLYGTIDRQSHEARQLVLNLAEVFRYVLQGNRMLISLGEELRIVRAYLEIEKLRLGERLQVLMSVPDSLLFCPIPVLSLQPLVENAVKHGVALKPEVGHVSVTAERTSHGVRISVFDTGVGFPSAGEKRSGGSGMGLENVRKRLAICFGPESKLSIVSNAQGTEVFFEVPEQAPPNVVVSAKDWAEGGTPAGVPAR